MKKTVEEIDIFVKYPELKEAMGTYKGKIYWNRTMEKILLECYRRVKNEVLLSVLNKEYKNVQKISMETVYQKIRKMKEQGRWREEND